MKSATRQNRGFTLTEMLVVLGIIVILVSISFPVFRRAQENSNQASCIVKLQQIGMAVKQYKLDYHVYPSSLYEIEDYLQVRSSGGKASHGKNMLICPDDETIRDSAYTNSSFPYSSYYDDEKGIVWNYWGLKYKKPDGSLYPDDVRGYAYSGSAADEAEYFAVMTNAGITNPKHYPRLANRFAPDYTIITHCVHHRAKTDRNTKQQLDLAVRLDGGVDKIFWFNYDWSSQPD